MSIKNNTWDQRYLRLAKIVASWSKDPSTKCGAILVRPNNTLASVGFNGFPKNMDDSPEKYENRDVKYPNIIHSEWNAIRSCQDHSLQGYSVYAYPMPPCDLCTAPLVQKGVMRAIHPMPPMEKLSRWKDQFDQANDMWRQRKATVTYKDIEDQNFDFNLDVIDGTDKWKKRFLEVAKELSLWSKDKETPRGAVIVRPDRTIASIGFNGFPQCVDDTPLIMNDREIIKSRLLTAELNSILFSQDPSLSGHSIFCYPGLPTLRSVVHLIQEGIVNIVCISDDNDPNLEDLASIENAISQVGGKLERVKLESNLTFVVPRSNSMK